MPRGNIDNLRVPTSEEARKNGKKGGEASGKSRKERRLLQDALQKQLSGMYEIENGSKKVTGYNAVAAALIKQALGGNVKAIVALRDSIGEKPKETVEVENNELTGIKIKFVNKSKPKTTKEKDPKIVGEYTPPTNAEN